MRLFGSRSLSWRLASRFTVSLVILMIGLNVTVAAIIAWRFPDLSRGADPALPTIIRDSLLPTRDGLMLRPTSALAQARESAPQLWFEARDATGHTVRYGAVPPEMEPLIARLPILAELDLKTEAASELTTKIATVAIDGSSIKVIYGGKADQSSLLAGVIAILGILFFPALIVPALLSFVAIPLLVRRALAGLRRTTVLAASISVDSLPNRLPTDDIPIEIEPLVHAVNTALDGIEATVRGRQRFLADAAHELRTPIAILQARLEGLTPSPGKNDLLRDVGRLGAVAEQLLDMQRFAVRQNVVDVDFVALCEQVVADLAPVAIEAGYDLEFATVPRSAVIRGDATSIERAVTNLVVNAIQHGGGSGTISVSIVSTSIVEVADEGPGIGVEARRIFEPFYRLRPSSTGAGLGLALVRQIAHLHGGHVHVVPTPRGACLRLVLG
ncbi:HAMP domain-containing histidine kinase [Sphingomonas sanguinis]|uniref:sensor histidine kinase n=1 Tax=Sphingomonas sanguinis TaxID=33051 RepID=UPI001C58FB59|nr:HAMP domain-containing sensor histidine kinase [Sphingomonas sanguinis]QXT34839.1 HAMP domain-containing histidine kinase [Sphingomonas sanguinis]